MFPKAGNSFRSRVERRGTRDTFAQLVAKALHNALDDSHRAVKTVMLWTGANERTVKNWLAGSHGPHGDYLLILLEKSDAVLDAVIGTLPADRLMELTVRLVRRTGSTVEFAPQASRPHVSHSPPKQLRLAALGPHDTSSHVECDPTTDPDPVPIGKAHILQLNHRQIWFLAELSAGTRPRASDLRIAHRVSDKTAKRDIAGLRHKRLIRYIGSKRSGHYMPITGRY